MRGTAQAQKYRDHSRLFAFLLVTAFVLVAGYAALTRFDRHGGTPEAPIQALQPQQAELDGKAATADAAEKQHPQDKAVAELKTRVDALVAEEQQLPAPRHTPFPTADTESTSAPQPSSAPIANTPTNANPPVSAVIARARAQVAEADDLLKQAKYPHPTATNNPASSAQERMARISALREQLGGLSTTPNTAANNSGR